MALTDLLTERELPHVTLDGTLSVALRGGVTATLMPHGTGWWVEAYEDGSLQTPVMSLHLATDVEAADLLATWRTDLLYGTSLSGLCECGWIVTPRDPHDCDLREPK